MLRFSFCRLWKSDYLGLCRVGILLDKWKKKMRARDFMTFPRVDHRLEDNVIQRPLITWFYTFIHFHFLLPIYCVLSIILGIGVRIVKRDEFFCGIHFLHEWTNVYTKHQVLWVYEKVRQCMEDIEDIEDLTLSQTSRSSVER